MGGGLAIDTFDVRPGEGIGPVALGMSRDHARVAMEATGEAVEAFDRWGGVPVLAMCDNAFQVSFGPDGTVEEVEAMGQGRDGQDLGAEPRVTALLRGIDVFSTPADVVAAAVDAEPDRDDREHGPSLDFPSIGLRPAALARGRPARPARNVGAVLLDGAGVPAERETPEIRVEASDSGRWS